MNVITALYFVEFVLVTIGIIFTLVAILVNKNLKKKKERCTHQVIAKIVDIEKRRMDRYSHYKEETVPMVSAVNCYEYECNFQKVKVWSSVGNMPGKFQIGQEVTLHCNPNDPTEFYSEEESTKTVIIVFKFVGIGLLLLSAIFLWIIISLI